MTMNITQELKANSQAKENAHNAGAEHASLSAEDKLASVARQLSAGISGPTVSAYIHGTNSGSSIRSGDARAHWRALKTREDDNAEILRKVIGP